MGDIRLHLTDKEVARLPAPETGWYLARDAELKGFFVVVGKRRKTYTVQADLRANGKRQSIRVSVGEAGVIATREARSIAKSYLALIAKGVHPRPEVARKPPQPEPARAATTLRSAWERYRDGHMTRKGRSARTIASYADHVDRVFATWIDRPLAELGADPRLVIDEHDRITAAHGPYIANGAMRTLRAVYNHARKSDRSLPADNPVASIDWNGEARRDTALGLGDLPAWFAQLAALKNPVRREFHLLTLLTGCRPDALKRAKPEHLDTKRRVLHIPNPKGGAGKAFDIPLSREIVRALVRLRRASVNMYPGAAGAWLFPAESAAGFLAVQKEDRTTLSKWGNDLRQSYRTLAQAAAVSEFDARLLMNHALPSVNAGYITRQKLLEGHLRKQQEAISTIIMTCARSAARQDRPVRDWLLARAEQIKKG